MTPKLYATEGVKCKDKTIHEIYAHQARMFWLVAEKDPQTGEAFGYANLDDDQNAEWGYFSIPELTEAGVRKVTDTNQKFPDALKDCMNIRKGFWGH